MPSCKAVVNHLLVSLAVGVVSDGLPAEKGIKREAHVAPSEGHTHKDSERILVKSVTRIAQDHDLIRHRCDQLKESPSLMLRSVILCIDQHLSSFRDLVVTCEVCVSNQDSSLMVGQEFSLVKLRARLSESEITIAHLKSLTADLITTHLGALPVLIIDKMRAQISTGYRCLSQVTTSLLSSAETFLLLQIRSWCVYGALRSSSKADFFIQASPVEEGGFCLDLSACPALINFKLARKMFEIGLVLVKLHKKTRLYTKNSHDTPYVRRHAALLSAIRSPIDPQMLGAAIESIRVSLSTNVLTLVLSKVQIIDLLGLLSQYFLLEDGEFALNLVEKANAEFRAMKDRHMGLLKDRTVHALLVRTISALGTSDESSEEFYLDTSCLYMRLLEVEEAANAPFSSFLFGVSTRLSFTINSPLDFFISEVDLALYSSLFDYLISIRRTQTLLHDRWRNRRREITHPTTTRKTWVTAFRASAFLETLAEYYYIDIIKAAFTDLKTQFRAPQQAHNPSDMAEQHRTVLKAIHKRLLPNERFINLMTKLLMAIDLMLGSASRSDEQRVMETSQAVTSLIEAITGVLALESGTEALLLKLRTGQYSGSGAI